MVRDIIVLLSIAECTLDTGISSNINPQEDY